MPDSAILDTERSISMAKGVNKVMLLGNVGKDPEIRTTAGGMTVASFSLATADRAKDAQGNWADKTEWHNLVCFQRTAEIVRDYVKKGSQIFVEGKIQTRSWDDKTSGEKKYKTEILVNDLSLLGGGPGRGEGGGSAAGYSNSRSSSSSSSASAPSNDYADQGITDEDIPF
jgi:single-strand DNA-binding protein